MTTARRFGIESFGVTIALEIDEALWSATQDALPPNWRDADPSSASASLSLRQGDADGAYALTRGGRPLGRYFRMSSAIDLLEDTIRLHVASTTRDFLFVHAGMVGWRGRAIVIPGRSGSGKSTLVRALVDAGADYGSDEYAVIDASGRVHPYPRQLSIRQGTHRRVRLSIAGTERVVRESLPLGLVCSTIFASGSAWNPRSLGAADAAMALFSHCIGAADRPGFALGALGRAVDGALALAGPRGEAASSVAAILDAVPANHSH